MIKVGKYDIIYQIEHWEDFANDPDIGKLWAEQYNHRYDSQRDLVLAVDKEKYSAMAQNLNLIVIVARQNRKPLGYCVLVLAKSLHYNSIDVYENTYWVSVAERGVGVGKGLVVKALEVAKDIGANRVFFADKKNLYAKNLLIGLGFKPGETVYELKLNKEPV